MAYIARHVNRRILNPRVLSTTSPCDAASNACQGPRARAAAAAEAGSTEGGQALVADAADAVDAPLDPDRPLLELTFENVDKVGRDRYCSLYHPTLFVPSFLGLSGIL